MSRRWIQPTENVNFLQRCFSRVGTKRQNSFRTSHDVSQPERKQLVEDVIISLLFYEHLLSASFSRWALSASHWRLYWINGLKQKIMFVAELSTAIFTVQERSCKLFLARQLKLSVRSWTKQHCTQAVALTKFRWKWYSAQMEQD